MWTGRRLQVRSPKSPYSVCESRSRPWTLSSDTFNFLSVVVQGFSSLVLKHPPEPGLSREGAGLATSPSKGEHLGSSGSGEFRLQHPHPQLGFVFNLCHLGGFAP